MTYVASLAGIFELIFADLLFKLIFADSSSQPFPPPFFFLGVCVSIGSGEYFQLNSFRVTVPVGGCMQGGGGGVPAGRVAMDTSLLCLRCSGSVQSLRYQFPRSSIGDESN